MAFIFFFLIIIQFDRIVSFYVFEHWNRRNKIYKKNVRVRLKLSLFRRNMYNVIVFVPSIADRLSLVAENTKQFITRPTIVTFNRIEYSENII